MFWVWTGPVPGPVHSWCQSGVSPALPGPKETWAMVPEHSLWLMQDQDHNREREEQRQQQWAHFLNQVMKKMSAMTLPEATVTRLFAVQPKLMKITAEDNPEAYLITFERVAEAAEWPKEHRAIKLAPCVMGEAQAAYRALETAIM